MNDWFEKLKAKWATPEGKKELDDYFNKYDEELKWKNQFNNKWFAKFNSLSLSEQQNLIDKIITKYESDKYKDKEYKKGYMPRNYLYNILLDYCEFYGEELETEECWKTKYRFCKDYIITEYCGQGTIITICKMNKEIKLYDRVYFLADTKVVEGIITEIKYSVGFFLAYNELLEKISNNNLSQNIRYTIKTDKKYENDGSCLYFRDEGEVFLSKEDMKEYLINLIK